MDPSHSRTIIITLQELSVFQLKISYTKFYSSELLISGIPLFQQELLPIPIRLEN